MDGGNSFLFMHIFTRQSTGSKAGRNSDKAVASDWIIATNKRMDINILKKRFTQNYIGFWKANLWIIVIYIIALIADGVSTIHFMLNEGIDSELHPAINIAAHIVGPVLGPLIGVIGKAIAGIIVAIYWRRIAWIILLVVSIVSFWAAWYNMWGWQYYEPGIIKWWPFNIS